MDLDQNKDRGTRKVYLPTETIHIFLIPFLAEQKSRGLLGPAGTCSLPSGACLVINSVPPFLIGVVG